MKKMRISHRYTKRNITIIAISIVFIVVITLLTKFFVVKENVMIDLIGKDINEIIKYAKDNDLNLEIKKEYNSEIDENILISQNIKKGTIINSNDKLTVIISLGKIDPKIYEEANVDELGRVPIMMYHGIHNLKNEETKYTKGNVDYYGYQRTKEAFINDLEFYYQSGYRMIRLKDYIDGVIDVELGLSPIVLTFDDGLKNNIKVTGLDTNGDIIIDENCAVGILESFKKKYPDFNVTATFFLNGGLFEQPTYNEQIIKWLVDNNYDIGNHSYSHVNFEKTTIDETEKEIGKMYQLLERIIPGRYVNIVALPFGTPYDVKHENMKHILSGTYEGFNYQTKANLRVGWESYFSPFSSNFDKTYIKRIRAYDNNGVDFDIEANFKALEKNRFISDGDYKKITVKEADKKHISVNTSLEIITY